MFQGYTDSKRRDRTLKKYLNEKQDWIGLSMVLLPRQHSIGYMVDGFYRSKDPTNSIKLLKEKNYKGKPRKAKNTKKHICIHIQNSTQ